LMCVFAGVAAVFAFLRSDNHIREQEEMQRRKAIASGKYNMEERLENAYRGVYYSRRKRIERRFERLKVKAGYLRTTADPRAFGDVNFHDDRDSSHASSGSSENEIVATPIELFNVRQQKGSVRRTMSLPQPPPRDAATEAPGVEACGNVASTISPLDPSQLHVRAVDLDDDNAFDPMVPSGEAAKHKRAEENRMSALADKEGEIWDNDKVRQMSYQNGLLVTDLQRQMRSIRVLANELDLNEEEEEQLVHHRVKILAGENDDDIAAMLDQLEDAKEQNKINRRNDFRRRFINIFLVCTVCILFELYPTLMEYSSKVLRCETLQLDVGNVTVMRTDPEVSCTSPEYARIRLFAWLVLLFSVIGVPVMMSFFIIIVARTTCRAKGAGSYTLDPDSIRITRLIRIENREIVAFQPRFSHQAYFNETMLMDYELEMRSALENLEEDWRRRITSLRNELAADKESLEAARSIFFFVCGNYKVRLWFWESFSLLKKMCLVLINVFIPELSLRILCSLYVMLIYGAINMEFTPWKDREMHITENLSIGALAVSFGLLQLLFYETVQQSEPTKNFIFLMLFIVNLLTVVMLLRMIVRTAGSASGALRPLLRFLSRQYKSFLRRRIRNDIRDVQKERNRLFRRYRRGQFLEELQLDGVRLLHEAENLIKASEQRVSTHTTPAAAAAAGEAVPVNILESQGTNAAIQQSQSSYATTAAAAKGARRRLSLQQTTHLHRGVTTFDQIVVAMTKSLREAKQHPSSPPPLEGGAPPPAVDKLLETTARHSGAQAAPTAALSWLSTEQLTADFMQAMYLVEVSYKIMLLPPEGDTTLEAVKKVACDLMSRIEVCVERMRVAARETTTRPLFNALQPGVADRKKVPQEQQEMDHQEPHSSLGEAVDENHVPPPPEEGDNIKHLSEEQDAVVDVDAPPPHDDRAEEPQAEPTDAEETHRLELIAMEDARDREQDRVKFLEVWLEHILLAEKECMYAYKRLWRSTRMLKGQFNDDELQALAVGHMGLSIRPSASAALAGATTPENTPAQPQLHNEEMSLSLRQPECAPKTQKKKEGIAPISRPASQQQQRNAVHQNGNRVKNPTGGETTDMEEPALTPSAAPRRRTLVLAEPVARSRRNSRYLSDFLPDSQSTEDDMRAQQM
jgi:hypothetical protein